VQYLRIAPEVKEALADGCPVVALESTVISHGLPYPDNLAIAREMEAAVRAAGALPATIAILGGRIVVGLDADQLERLAQAEGVRKCSRRDIPIAVARREDGATTVAGTMVLAQMAGVRLFATGGIGGVHRGHPFDVSADLVELGRTPVCVVCAGAKSLLDLPATMEVLETQGVPVVGYGTDAFPAFYTPDSGLRVTVRADSPTEVAALLRAQKSLGERGGGMLVTVPVPAAEALESAEAETAIAEAVCRAEAQGIVGPAVTPFLLAQIAEITAGRSVRANRALLLNNCRVAAQIALALAEGAEDN
jgi:pseudouridine-5'-phosphate glycosidase